MITDNFSCSCGNKNPRKTKYYDGHLGYEAIVCIYCGRIHDYDGEHEADDWSRAFVELLEASDSDSQLKSSPQNSFKTARLSPTKPASPEPDEKPEKQPESSPKTRTIADVIAMQAETFLLN